MTERELEFMGKIIDIFAEVEALTKEYGYEDKVMSAMVFGLIDEVYENDDSNLANLQSIFSFNLKDRGELHTIWGVMDEGYEEPKGNGYSDLFGDMDISLN
tara:strand:- start:1160 stop:1462 length:303 start_codon:yes stop_codon:yes gene_type:complete